MVTREMVLPGDRMLRRWAEVRAAVEAELAGFLATAAASLIAIEPAAAPLADVVVDLASSGGKRIRPLFVHYGHVLAGGCGLAPAEVRLGAAVEMLHTFALVQDDVIDSSLVRRGEPSGLARLGMAGAILASDVALTWADQLVDTTSLPPPVLTRVRDQLRVLRLETLAGEFLDACVSGSDVAHRRRNVLKTARYTTTRPLIIGALIGPEMVDLSLLQAFGDAIGVCFQLRDDQLDDDGAPGCGAALEEEVEAARAVLTNLRVGPELEAELSALIDVAARRSR